MPRLNFTDLSSAFTLFLWDRRARWRDAARTLLESLLQDRGVAVLAVLSALPMLLAVLVKLAMLAMLPKAESGDIGGDIDGDIGPRLDDILSSEFATSVSAACTARSALSTAINVFWAWTLASPSSLPHSSRGLFNPLVMPAAFRAAGPKSKAD